MESITLAAKPKKTQTQSVKCRSIKCNIRSKAKKASCLRKYGAEKSMPKNHSP